VRPVTTDRAASYQLVPSESRWGQADKLDLVLDDAINGLAVPMA
jgi:hypothetical protein